MSCTSSRDKNALREAAFWYHGRVASRTGRGPHSWGGLGEAPAASHASLGSICSTLDPAKALATFITVWLSSFEDGRIGARGYPYPGEGGFMMKAQLSCESGIYL